IETTGLSPQYDEIIEIAAIKYKSGEKVNLFSTLVKPEYEIDEYIIELTGITNEMVATAPKIADCIAEFKKFIGNEIIVGYNVTFDINFLFDNLLEYCDEKLSNDFVDVMRIAKKVLPELSHHRQKDVAEFFEISIDGAHRAEADCLMCNECLENLKMEIKAKGVTLDDFIHSYKFNHNGISAKDISTEKTEFNEGHPLFGKVCVFTGTLEKMQRKEAMQLVADLGGIPGDGVTKKTNYLILGNNDYCKTIKDGKSSKQKKAEKMILEGVDLQIVPEAVFYDIVLGE
ncbi:MAG: exonuclease, partial [Treponema sp.]|nr:exonuclease [Treponema sp.]